MTNANDAERAIRSAASALAEAITAGRAAGLSVAWPSRPEDLPAMAISATGAAKRSLGEPAGSPNSKAAKRAAEPARKASDKA